MAHSTNTTPSNFTTNHYLIYLIATALLMGTLLYSIGATRPIDYAANPKTGVQSPVMGESPAHHE